MTKFIDDKQFAYWLQGYFEITGTSALNDKQALQIGSAALKVEQKGPLAKYVIDLLTNGTISAQGPAISKFLNDTFKHDIDPSYSGNQTAFNDAHSGGHGPTLRC